VHNIHPHFYSATKLSQASYDFISHSPITRHGRDPQPSRLMPVSADERYVGATFLLPPEILYMSTGVCRGPISCLTIVGVGSKCVHGRIAMRLWMHPQTYACMHSKVLTSMCPQRVCVSSQTHSRKIPCLHISAALSAPFPITLPGERREGRGEELAVTPVPRTSSGPIRQLKLDVCVLSASSNC